MFVLACYIGIYSYLIFILGITHNLHGYLIGSISLFYFCILCVLSRKKITMYYRKSKEIKIKNVFLAKKILIFLYGLLYAQVGINLIGVIGPEIAFDSLWYHLTLPKLYLSFGSLSFIPGGLLYYSAMPQLVEMLYIPALLIGNEYAAKFLHFLFGVGILFVMYEFLKERTSRVIGVLAGVIFYSNLVVGWESITAYIDLGRSLFELLAFVAFMYFIKSSQLKYVIWMGIMSGFAIASKLLSIASIFILSSMLVIFSSFKKRATMIQVIGIFILVALFIPLPWFLYAYLATGNIVYPFFTPIYPISPHITSLWDKVYEVFMILFFSPDPISPVYTIGVILFFLYYRVWNKEIKIIAVYCAFAVIIWAFTPPTGGGRFLLPYLPVFSIFVAYMVYDITIPQVKNIMIGVVCVVSIISIMYRGAANSKFIPVILGMQTKAQFLAYHLDFNFGDFYDLDGYFKEKVGTDRKVLLYGFHNLYYVNFPFIDSSYVKKGDRFFYIATKDTEIPKRFSDWNRIYSNKKTKVNLYTKEEKEWVY